MRGALFTTEESKIEGTKQRARTGPERARGL